VFSSGPNVAKLAARLSSSNAATAKEAASKIDQLIYPNYGSGPRMVTVGEDYRIRAQLYEKIRTPEFIDPLLKALTTGTESAREYACTALGAIGDDQAVPTLIQSLADVSPNVRKAAACSLAFFHGTTGAIPELIRTLNDSAADVTQAAAHTLGLLRATDAVPALMNLFERDDLEIKIAAIGALGWIGDPRSLALVRSAQLDKNRKLKKAAKFALANYDLKRRAGSDPDINTSL
jgi:HEAT repeat protein